MNTPRIKFCGMTRKEDIEAAEELQADFVGFIFVPSSPRSLTLDDAELIRGAVSNAKTVGVFTDNSREDIQEHIKEFQLDFVQLHGEPDVKRVQECSVPVIQAFRGVPEVKVLEQFIEHCPYLLIDKADSKLEADFDAVAALPEHIRSKLFVAGGLTPGNVRTVIDRIQPYAVDCARGIESSPGRKNPYRMFAFYQALSP